MHRFVFMLHIFLLCVCVCVCYSRGLDLWGLWVNGWGWGVLQGLYSFVNRQVCLCICLFVHSLYFCICLFVCLFDIWENGWGYGALHSATETQVEAPPLPSPSTLSPSISLSNMSNTQTCLTCHMSNTLPSPSTLSPSISLCLRKLPKQIIDLQLLDPASPEDQLLSQIIL